MARGQINTPKSNKGGSKKKIKPTKFAFNLGFDPGFTRILLNKQSELQAAQEKGNKTPKKKKQSPEAKKKNLKKKKA
jgi:hypothetical protein